MHRGVSNAMIVGARHFPALLVALAGCVDLTRPLGADATLADGSPPDPFEKDAPPETSGPGDASATGSPDSGPADSPSSDTSTDDGFRYRRAITIDRTKVGNSGAPATLTSFPFLFSTVDATFKTVA